MDYLYFQKGVIYKMDRKICPVCKKEEIVQYFTEVQFGQEWAFCPCGVAFQTRPDMNSTFQRYENDGVNRQSVLGAMEETLIYRWKAMDSQMSPVMRKKGKFIEVGSSLGNTVYYAKKVGWDATGIEYSKSACQFAKERFNVDLLNGKVEELKISKNSFDLVCIFEVIEHVEDPEALLKMANSWLKEKGYLVLTTPNGGSDSAKFYFRKWQGYHIDHLQVFSFEALRKLLNNNGFKVFNLIECYHMSGFSGSMMLFCEKEQGVKI